MKNTIKSTLSILLAVMMVVCMVSCGETIDKEGLWENATYRKDMEFGKGAKTAVVEVKIADQIVTFTIHTDKETVGEAMFEHGLISGDQGEFGLYIKAVNGITADYDIDQSYWAFTKGGEYMMTGVDGTEFADGEHYELVYTKQ